MLKSRGLGWPITLGVVMIVLLLAVIIGWIVGFGQLAVYFNQRAAVYWTLLGVGTAFLLLVLCGVVLYLIISVKEIRLNQRQANFVASVTHELKSPLASLKLSVQTLGRRSVSEEQRQDFHQFMLEDIERLDSLINHLLAAARMDQINSKTDSAELELSTLLAGCVSSLRTRYRLPAEAVTLECEPIHIQSGPLEAELLFSNLLDNAAKYAGDPPKIEIHAKMRGNAQAVIRITDNGPGIPLADRRRIFGRFVRLGSELERRRPGTGLGLYIVRELLARMRGRIHVRSRVGGSGTTFELELPARPVVAGSSEPEAMRTA